MATIVFLHGFGSVGDSPKSQQLKSAFPKDTVLAPNLPNDPDAVVALVSELLVRYHEPLLFVGTSLGGFWANYFGKKFEATAILINPSITPSERAKEYIGKTINNYATGEPITTTQETVDGFARCEKEINESTVNNPIQVFIAANDEVLDYRKAIMYPPFRNKCRLFLDGGHRFEKHWDAVVVRYIWQLLNNQLPVIPLLSNPTTGLLF